MDTQYGNWKITDKNQQRLKHSSGNVFFVHPENEPDNIHVLKIRKDTLSHAGFIHEVKVAALMDHPNVIKVVDYSLDDDNPYMVTEYCKGGTIRDSDLKNWSIDEKGACFRLICKATAYIQSQGYTKADGRLRNTFLKEDGRTPVIGDLERAHPITENGYANTIAKLAEVFWEIMEGKKYSQEWAKEHELNQKIEALTRDLGEARKERAALQSSLE